MSEQIWSVSDFVAVLNQTLEFAYPGVTIVGELANFRISKNKWVYFDLKDENASVRCFGTVYMLPGPLEDGLSVQVNAAPRLHPQFGFSLNLMSILPVGEGSLRRAAALLEAKLTREGLFDEARKRPLPYPPQTIGLITSGESAAYADFIKITNARWGGLDIKLADIQVQGEAAIEQISQAITLFNQLPKIPEVLVLIRGGGSADDLMAFNSESVTRSVAASRIPTLVAIGHEIDTSLAEKAADKCASTPSNAAELLTPDKKHELVRLKTAQSSLNQHLSTITDNLRQQVKYFADQFINVMRQTFNNERQKLATSANLLEALSPNAALIRGYAILRSGDRLIKSGRQVRENSLISAQVSDSVIDAQVKKVDYNK